MDLISEAPIGNRMGDLLLDLVLPKTDQTVYIQWVVGAVFTAGMGSGAVQESRGSSRLDDMVSRGEIF